MSEYSQDFEEEIKPSSPTEEDHHLRLSLELHSIRNTEDSFQLYTKFSYKLLGTRKTSSVPIRKTQENRIENAFQSQEFFMSKSELYSFLASTPLQIELWHSDKYSKDVQIGSVTVEMNQVLRAPIKKTTDSVLRVLDLWQEVLVPEDEKNEVKSRVNGELRVLIFLEDLGVKRKGAVLARTENPADYKAVLELEMWKRAEEAKWKAGLKAREAEYLGNLAAEWQENENRRESQFQKSLQDLNSLENKVRMKTLELQKREKALVKLEEAKKMKIDEVIRTLTLKEEEILITRKTFQEITGKAGKETKTLEIQLEKFKSELFQAEEVLRNLKREQDFEAVSKMKQEIEDLMRKNLQMSKDLLSFSSQREVLVKSCESTREEFLRILYDYEEEKRAWDLKEQEKLSALQTEIEKIKLDSLAVRASHECVRCSVTNLKLPWPAEVENPEIKRLRDEIESLINSGMYNEEDPIIQELDKQIKVLQTV
jgi:centrosomal protein CEP120